MNLSNGLVNAMGWFAALDDRVNRLATPAI